MLSDEHASELLYRIMFISLTVNLCLAIRLSLTGIVQSVKLCRKKSQTKHALGLSNKEKDIIHM